MPWKRSALIVEDQPFLGMVASDVLRESGFETYHAYDAAEAMAMLRAGPQIDVLVTDADLPGPVNGVQLTQMVSRECPRVRAVIMTSDRVERAGLPEGTSVLRKPYSSAEMSDLVLDSVC